MNFDRAFERTVSIEGGYVNDPADPGGETKWGISKRAYPHLDIAALTREDARDLYRRDLWERAQMDELPEAVQFQVFDFAVNSGMETAVRKLQAAAGVADDGHVGPVTLAAVRAMSPCRLLLRYVGQRLGFLAKLSKWDAFGRGWANRIAQDLAYGAEDVA